MSAITAEEFKTVRESLNLSTRDVADMFDIRGERTVRAWEAGKAPIPDEVGDRLFEIDSGVEEAVDFVADEFMARGDMVLYRCETEDDVILHWTNLVEQTGTCHPKICNAFVARLRCNLMRQTTSVVIITGPPADDA